MKDWAKDHYDAACAVASQSINRGTKVGAVIYRLDDQSVVGQGFNRMVEGMPNREEYHQARLKDLLWEHAERDAIFHFTRAGTSTVGMGMACSWYPCAACARAIVQAGIIELVALEPQWGDIKWGEDWKAATLILATGKVRVIWASATGCYDGQAGNGAHSANLGAHILRFPGPLEPRMPESELPSPA